MQQKFIYILNKECAIANHHKLNHHWLELPDGRVLMSAEFVDESHQTSFEKMATVEPVAQDEPISHEHAAALAHLGVKAGDSLKQVRKSAKRIHPLL